MKDVNFSFKMMHRRVLESIQLKSDGSFIDAANKMPNLFPEKSKTGGDTSASPEIWQHMDDVKARFEKLAAESKAAQASIKDLDGFKAAYRNVAQICDGCHEHYRVKKG